MAGFRVINFIAVRSFLVLTILPYGGFPKSGFHRAVQPANPHEHPVVLPHVSHFMQVPLRTSVKLPHSPHISPS